MVPILPLHVTNTPTELYTEVYAEEIKVTKPAVDIKNLISEQKE
jgi:hypothetical protein